MRILIIITKGDLGGAQTHVFELCRALKQKFEFLVLIGGQKRSPLELELKKIGVATLSVGALSNSLSPLHLIKSIREVRNQIKIWKPDVIHAHSAVAGVVGRIAGFLARTPVIYTVHGFGFKPQVPLLRRTVVLSIEKLLARLTTRMICVSQFELHLAKKLSISADRITVVSNGIADWPSRCDPGIEPVSLIMVARMAPPKRHDLLLQALVLLRERGMNLPKVIFAGGGPELINAQISCDSNKLDMVEMPGDLGGIPDILARNQLFILLSDHEGQPISIIEAMRAGMPIIASDLPGIRSQISHRSEGLLINNNANAVADALQMLLNDTAMRIRMGKSARVRYESEFNSENMANDVAGIYRILEKSEAI